MWFRFSFFLRYFFILLSCFSVWPALAQGAGSQCDSLLLELKTARHDSTRVKLYSDLSDVCDLENVLAYSLSGMAICEKMAKQAELSKRYKWYYAGLINNAGYYYSKHGDESRALEYYKRSAGILEQIDNKREAAILMNNVAYIYQNQGDQNLALQYFFKNLKVQEELKDEKGMSYTLINIGHNYSLQSDLAKAMEYFDKAIILFQKRNDKSGLALANLNKGVLFKESDPIKALNYYKNGLALYEEDKDMHGVALSLNHVSTMYNAMGKSDTALAYIQRSFELIEKFGYKDVLGTSNMTMARVLLKQGRYAEAKTYALRSLEQTKARRNPEEIRSAAYVLKEIYKKQNNFKGAFDMYELEIKMNDSIVNDNTKKQLLKKELEYDYEKKELQNRLAQEKMLHELSLENEHRNTRKNILLTGLAFLVLTLAISAFYIYKFFRQKSILNAARANELNQKLLRAQMNPHFIFNSVDNIQSLIYQKQDKEAISYLTKFSKLTRQILENSDQNYISLSEELAMTENYLSIQQLLYNNKFSYKVGVEEGIDADEVLLPPMLTQPFIENAIKHGLKSKEEGGFVNVWFYKQGEAIFFEVTDNGSGLMEKDPADPHRSMSLRIVADRLNNNPSKKNIVISVKNVMENNTVKGVCTSFEIPYIYDR